MVVLFEGEWDRWEDFAQWWERFLPVAQELEELRESHLIGLCYLGRADNPNIPFPQQKVIWLPGGKRVSPGDAAVNLASVIDCEDVYWQVMSRNGEPVTALVWVEVAL